MDTRRSQTGAALIMLIGIVAVLAILSATLVVTIANQQGATARERRATQSFYAAEAALDTGVQLAKVDRKMSTTEEWLTQEDLQAAFYGFFPVDATVVYRVYDNLSQVDYNIKWDQGGPTDAHTPDGRMWVEATVTHQGKTTRTRALIWQGEVPLAEALPKAVTYSDTGIRLDDNSDIYAVNEDNTPDTSGPPYQTSITAGGTWVPTMDSGWAEVGRFTMNGSTDLAAPGTNVQSLGITVNGSVSMAGSLRNGPLDAGTISDGVRSFDSVTIRPFTVGFLSDYFDQKAQTELANESQIGGTPAAMPAAPPSWTYSGRSITGSLLTTITGGSYSNTTEDLYLLSSVNRGDMTIDTSSARTYRFRNLYIARNLSIKGPVTFTADSLYVGGTLTIAGPTRGSTVVNNTINGPLYINGTGSSAVTDLVQLSASSVYCRGPLAISNSQSTSVTDSLGQIYCVGNFSVSGRVALENGTSSLYGGGNVTLAGPSSGTTTHTLGLIYMPKNDTSRKTLTFSGNVNVKATEVTTYGDFTISGATTPVKNWLGHVYVNAISSTSNESKNRGTIDWSGTASVTSRDYTRQADPASPEAQPQPMWLGRYFSRKGTYNDEYGKVWVPGNSSTSVVFNSTGASTVMCPLLCTTEKNVWGGNVTYGTRTQPMVFFFMCDNNGIYPQVFEYSGTGTYYGLMVINESTIEISNGSSTKPSIQGAVFAGCPYDPRVTTTMSKSDIVLKGSSCIAYDQHVVGEIATSSLKTTTTITQIVPGSWQQLPIN